VENTVVYDKAWELLDFETKTHRDSVQILLSHRNKLRAWWIGDRRRLDEAWNLRRVHRG